MATSLDAQKIEDDLRQRLDARMDSVRPPYTSLTSLEGLRRLTLHNVALAMVA